MMRDVLYYRFSRAGQSCLLLELSFRAAQVYVSVQGQYSSGIHLNIALVSCSLEDGLQTAFDAT